MTNRHEPITMARGRIQDAVTLLSDTARYLMISLPDELHRPARAVLWGRTHDEVFEARTHLIEAVLAALPCDTASCPLCGLGTRAGYEWTVPHGLSLHLRGVGRVQMCPVVRLLAETAHYEINMRRGQPLGIWSDEP